MKNSFPALQNGDVWDAIVIGAGIAGGVTALQLGDAGWRVLLVEKTSFPREKVCGGFMGPENSELLKTTGIWEKLKKTDLIPLEQMWLTSPRGASVRMGFPQASGPGLAVCRKNLDAAIVECAQERGVVFAAPAHAEQAAPGVYMIHSPHQAEPVKVFARHVIDARGGAALKEAATVGFGMAAYFEGVRWMKNRVILHFANDGHFGLDPVLGDRVTGCFVATQAMLDRVGKNPQKLFEDFCAQNRFLASQMKRAKQVSSWQGIPLKLSSKPVFFEKGVFRVGDAVATVDPVVGGGMTLALQGASMLAESLLEYDVNRVDEVRAARAYARRWNQSFGWKLPVSHLWGRVGHHPFFTEGMLRLISMQRNLLKKLFEWHHSALPAVKKLEGVA